MELADQGLPVIPGRERSLLEYLALNEPSARYRAAIQTGWVDGHPAFVLPHETLGDLIAGERVIYQPERYSPTAHSVRTAGSFEGWQQEVAARCVEHPVLMFGIAGSLTAPLLHLLHLESGGFHVYGQTSMGKITMLQVAASVWREGSDPAEGHVGAFVRKWNLTKNAREGLAAAHNDLPLCLDKVSEADFREFGRMIYQLAGGQGKVRLRADTTLKPPKVW